MNNILIFFIILNGFYFSCSSNAQNYSNGNFANYKSEDERVLPKPLSQSIEYGVGAGALMGIAAISDFKKNYRANFDPHSFFRCVSYGLYGGILLGLYLSYGVNDEPVEGLPETRPEFQSAPSADVPQSRNGFYFEEKIILTHHQSRGRLSLHEINLVLKSNGTQDQAFFISTPILRF